jgi:uncharacterized protein YcfJ
MTRRLIAVGSAMLLCSGCVTTPTGPTVKVMPGPEKSFEQFQADDAVCRQWSLQQAGGNPQTAAVQGTTTGAAIGTVVGAGGGGGGGAGAGAAGAGCAGFFACAKALVPANRRRLAKPAAPRRFNENGIKFPFQ